MGGDKGKDKDVGKDGGKVMRKDKDMGEDRDRDGRMVTTRQPRIVDRQSGNSINEAPLRSCAESVVRSS